jgi:hypothetical protein
VIRGNTVLFSLHEFQPIGILEPEGTSSHPPPAAFGLAFPSHKKMADARPSNVHGGLGERSNIVKRMSAGLASCTVVASDIGTDLMQFRLTDTGSLLEMCWSFQDSLLTRHHSYPSNPGHRRRRALYPCRSSIMANP